MAKAQKKSLKLPDIARDTFAAHARALRGEIDGQPVVFSVKQFATGSYGWSYQGKLAVDVGDQPVTVSANINLIVSNSKNG